MKKSITLLFTLLSIFTYGQNFNPKTITLPKDVTVEDLSFLKEEIKDAQVVMLGEGSHFDGNMFEMKTKVIKYLYQEMGFKTMAFESGIYDVWKAQQEINAGENVKKAFLKSLFSIWTKTNEFQSFIQFYETNKTDLKLFGFDNQLMGIYSNNELVNDLYAYCAQNNISLKLNKNDFQLLIEALNSTVFDDEDIAYNEYKKALTTVLNKIEKKPKTETHFYWSQIIKSLLALGEDAFTQKESIISTYYASTDDNIRDKQMADNLLAYIQTHPNEKIICWGASAHFINDMTSVNTPVVKDFIPMGSYIKTALKEKVYSLATLNASEEFCFDNLCEKTPIDPASFENYLKQKGATHLFISSNQPEMKKVQLNRLFSPVTFIESRLDLLHDGYIYLNESKLSTKALNDDQDDIKIENVSSNKVAIIPKQEVSNIDDYNKNLPVGTVNLNEVVLYGKSTAYQIIKKVIDNLANNYPDKEVSSNVYTNIITNIGNTNCLNLDFIAKQYETGYFSYNRCVFSPSEIKWNVQNGYKPNYWRQFFELISNPIRHRTFLGIRKYKKFNFTLKEIETHNNKEVYVISFSTNRNYWNFTHRRFLSDYCGKLYINKDDLAIVKIIEDWKVTEYPIEFSAYGLNLNGEFENYNKGKDFTHERNETDFVKIDNLYFISQRLIEISGNVYDSEKKSLPFTTTLKSYWSDFNTINPEKIKFKDEVEYFDKVKYNKEFWDKFVGYKMKCTN